MIKILVVPDLHLYDKELEDMHTAGYAEQSVKILQNIRRVLTEEFFDVVVLGGDIQHDRLSEMKYISRFYKELHEISKIVTNHTNKPHILSRMRITGEDTLKDYDDVSVTKLFAIHGQHDQRYEGQFTFYHMLLENNVIANPNKIRIGDLQINLFNHRYDPLTLKAVKDTGVRKLIGIYHNPIKHEGQFSEGNTDIKSKEDFQKYKNKSGSDNFKKEAKLYSPSEHMAFANVDYAVMNDVHLQMQDQKIKTYNNETVVVTPGSLGRTSRESCHHRNIGKLVVLEIDETDYNISHRIIPIQLEEYNDLFPDNTMEILKDEYNKSSGYAETKKQSDYSESKSFKGGRYSYDYKKVGKAERRDSTGKFTADGVAWYIKMDERNFEKAVNLLYKKHNDKKSPFKIEEKHLGIFRSMTKIYKNKWKATDNQIHFIKSVVFQHYVEDLTKISNNEL